MQFMNLPHEMRLEIAAQLGEWLDYCAFRCVDKTNCRLLSSLASVKKNFEVPAPLEKLISSLLGKSEFKVKSVFFKSLVREAGVRFPKPPPTEQSSVSSKWKKQWLRFVYMRNVSHFLEWIVEDQSIFFSFQHYQDEIVSLFFAYAGSVTALLDHDPAFLTRRNVHLDSNPDLREIWDLVGTLSRQIRFYGRFREYCRCLKCSGFGCATRYLLTVRFKTILVRLASGYLDWKKSSQWAQGILGRLKELKSCVEDVEALHLYPSPDSSTCKLAPNSSSEWSWKEVTAVGATHRALLI
ncbi:hypothetical protein BJ508DRAFT_346531 [Ascobolus immersus RN42]|uniref:Uncharacterized protein n=1 Tax=Ascobolus immersus RN42 TaxID=1160509 RepID=A0A3N4ILI4_ASCIM|nr:hypothetical protein BJ508DRAFT_346531 [Ascobolus immersus RN42]